MRQAAWPELVQIAPSLEIEELSYFSSAVVLKSGALVDRQSTWLTVLRLIATVQAFSCKFHKKTSHAEKKNQN